MSIPPNRNVRGKGFVEFDKFVIPVFSTMPVDREGSYGANTKNMWQSDAIWWWQCGLMIQALRPSKSSKHTSEFPNKETWKTRLPTMDMSIAGFDHVHIQFLGGLSWKQDLGHLKAERYIEPHLQLECQMMQSKSWAHCYISQTWNIPWQSMAYAQRLVTACSG